MRGLVLAVLLGCVYQAYSTEPEPCEAPARFSCSFYEVIDKYHVHGKLWYDGKHHRQFILQELYKHGKKLTLATLMLYEKNVVYYYNKDKDECSKKRLGDHFHDAGVPKDAKFWSRAVLGSKDIHDGGLKVETWYGYDERIKANFTGTWTKHGCLGVNFHAHDSKVGPFTSYFFDYEMGIKDDDIFDVPKACRWDGGNIMGYIGRLSGLKDWLKDDNTL